MSEVLPATTDARRKPGKSCMAGARPVTFRPSAIAIWTTFPRTSNFVPFKGRGRQNETSRPAARTWGRRTQ